MSNTASDGEKLIVVVGSGPGIGVGVGSRFASHGFGRVALISHNAERLKEDAETVERDPKRMIEEQEKGNNEGEEEKEKKKLLTVKTYVVDVANVLALEKTLRQVDHELGPPEVVVYNAAKLRQTRFGDVSARELTEDFQVAVAGLYTTAMWAMPHLSALAANVRKDARPSFLVTGSGLYKDPVPMFFALAMCRAAQVNLAGSLAKEYGPRGVHVATVAVGGNVTPDSDVFSPVEIVEKFWMLYQQGKGDWEEIVHIGC